MTLIFVAPRRTRLFLTDGTVSYVQLVLLERGDGSRVHLQNQESLPELGKLEIWTRHGKLKLPESLEGLLAGFLAQNHRRTHPYDCYDFACMWRKVELHDKKYLFRYWKLGRRWFLRTGDVVFFINPAEKLFRHAAIYLGRGLFVSVYGKGGDVEFTTMRDLRHAFPTPVVMCAIPRKWAPPS